MGTILPADDGFEAVNKVARKGLWPESAIRKVRGHTGTNDLHYAVEIQDADGHWHLASKPGRLLSPQYLLVHNRELKAMAEEVAVLTGYTWRPYREYFDGTATSTCSPRRTSTRRSPRAIRSAPRSGRSKPTTARSGR